MNSQILEDRLVDFSANVILFIQNLSTTFANDHLGKQLIRSSTSAALNYGEAKAAESKKDFIHKLKIVLKELRESFVSFKILSKIGSTANPNFQALYSENNELISIFVATLKKLHT
jgi:four helix bundle protein